MRAATLVLIALMAVSCKRAEQRHLIGQVADSAIALVRQYVERDSRGERLATAAWFLRVVAWPEDPAFDSYTVIAGFAFGQPAETGDSVLVPVSYHRLGWMQTTGRASVRFVASDSAERYVFRLGQHEGRWVIAHPRLEPHVVADTALAKAPLSKPDREALQARLHESRQR